MRYRLRYLRLAAAIVLAAYIPACTGYTTLANPSEALAASPNQPKQVRVTLKTGERFELAAPVVSGDSLRGIPPGGPARSVALADVAKVEVQKTDGAKTAGLVAGVLLVGGLIAGAVALSSYSSSSCSFESIDYTGM